MKTITKITPNQKMRLRTKLRLSIALSQKLKQGTEEYGEEWAGDDPLVEGFDDALDVIIYTNIAQGYHDDAAEYILMARECFEEGIEFLAKAIEKANIV